MFFHSSILSRASDYIVIFYYPHLVVANKPPYYFTYFNTANFFLLFVVSFLFFFSKMVARKMSGGIIMKGKKIIKWPYFSLLNTNYMYKFRSKCVIIIFPLSRLKIRTVGNTSGIAIGRHAYCIQIHKIRKFYLTKSKKRKWTPVVRLLFLINRKIRK